MRCGKPRILMIDDNVADIGLVRAVLDDSDNPVELYSVRDGIEGITYLKHAESSGRPDLIIMDINMPRMDGLQALIQIKGDPDICDIPVIVFTASETEADIIACYRAQAAAFISKPLTVDGLVTIIHTIIKLWLGGLVAVLPGRLPAHHSL